MSVLNIKESFFGLDIGSTGLRLVYVEPSATGAPALQTYSSVALEKSFLESDSPNDHQELSKIIAKLVADSNIKTRNVAISLSSKDAFTTVVRMPKMDNKELGKAIELQADQYVPISVRNAKLDWHVLGDVGDNQMDVFLVAAQNDTIEKYSKIVTDAGLNLLAIETDAVAITRALTQEDGNPTLILSLGAKSSDVIVARNGVPLLARSTNIGGQTFERYVTENLNVDEAQAQQFLLKFGATKTKLEGQVLKAMQSPLDDLVEEIKKSMKFSSTQYPDLAIEKLVMTGRSVALPELPLYFANAVGLKVEIANSWSHISYPAQLQDNLMARSLEFTVAAGLAQRALV